MHPETREHRISELRTSIARLKTVYRTTPPQYNSEGLRLYRIKLHLNWARELIRLEREAFQDTCRALAEMGVMHMVQDGKIYV